MKHISKWISKHHLLIIILSIILFIPAVFGYINTKINYDILIYLPDNIDTIKGQNILTNDFNLGSYAFVMTDKNAYDTLNLEEEIKNIESVNQVISIYDLLGTTIPTDMLPDDVKEKLYKEDETIIVVTFEKSISDDSTIEAIRKLRNISDKNNISSMTAMIVDTMDISNEEFLLYVVISVILCLIVLMFATDSFIVPILLLLNIGTAIIFNMGSNILLGQISYITQAITAILQLGVTTDFSIFLYHKYKEEKEKTKDKIEAMSKAIEQTFKSVLGSSLTTFAGFLALCTMELTLGKDIGIVMAKGVLCGLICVMTLFPALLLQFDKLIDKTTHKKIFPEFKLIQKFSNKHYIVSIIIFLILLIPAIIGNSNYKVYYKLDESLPKDLGFQVANSKLADNYNIISPQIIILDKNIKLEDINKKVEEIKNEEGIDLVLSPQEALSDNIKNMLPDSLDKIMNNDKNKIIITNSTYPVASKELNTQITKLNEIVKKYDENGIIAGEGALMNDLVSIADHDFKTVNYTSIAVIFIIMLFVLKSLSLPIVLIITIEFAIFLNMACAYFTGTELPFVASIVVGTIQLGATIDYAILMSNKYVEERKNNKKEKAIEKSLSFSVPSIITSALCFFAATIGVALYTKIDMIGSICMLLARGSMISMLVVILILPAFLKIFDKIIIKEEKHEK